MPGCRDLEKQALGGSHENLPEVIMVWIQKPKEGARLDQNETLRAVNHSKIRILTKRSEAQRQRRALRLESSAQAKMEAVGPARGVHKQAGEREHVEERKPGMCP